MTVLASLKLRPDGGLTVQTSPLPRLVGGVPVSIRPFTLTLDRPGFIVTCGPVRYTSPLSATGASPAPANGEQAFHA